MICFLGLGSNMSNRLDNLNNAIDIISKDKKNQVINISNFYESEPMYNHSLNKFYNGVIKVETSYSPKQLLTFIKNIEEELGRRKSTNNRYENRPIDIDILCCGSIIIRTRELVVPHPHIKERKFVLKPWSDIDSDYIIANENRRIKELLEATTDKSILKKICA